MEKPKDGYFLGYKRLNETGNQDLGLNPRTLFSIFCSFIHLYLLDIYHILRTVVLQKNSLFKGIWKNESPTF